MHIMASYIALIITLFCICLTIKANPNRPSIIPNLRLKFNYGVPRPQNSQPADQNPNPPQGFNHKQIDHNVKRRKRENSNNQNKDDKQGINLEQNNLEEIGKYAPQNWENSGYLDQYYNQAELSKICSGISEDERAGSLKEKNVNLREDFDGLGSAAMIKEILTVINKGLGFIGRNYRTVNLDTIIGTRILEGQMTVLLGRLGDKTSTNADVQQECSILNQQDHINGDERDVKNGKEEELELKCLILELRKILETSRNVSGMAIQQIKKNEKDYYQRLGNLLAEGTWELNYKSRDVDEALLEKFRRKESGAWREAMREEESDQCLTGLIGTADDQSLRCEMTDVCWMMMTSSGFHAYSLTHQVFYHEIGRMMGCFSKRILVASDMLTEEFCTKILHEAETIAMCGFPQERQDLFMEQVGLCGMLGYRQFFLRSWLNQIISWQNKNSGCWTREEQDLKDYEAAEEKGEIFKRDTQPRVKREDRVFRDGCSSHKTTVALAALAGYLRYSLEDLAPAALLHIAEA